MRCLSLGMADGRTIAEQVRIADSFFARTIGLLQRRALQPHEGLLLIPGGHVHTLGLRFPIDVVFLDRRMRVLSLQPNLAPHRICLAPRRTAHVLELAAGRIAAVELLRGMYIVVRDEADAVPLPQASALVHARPTTPCPSNSIQFSLRLPLQRCARVESTLGCMTRAHGMSTRRARSG